MLQVPKSTFSKILAKVEEISWRENVKYEKIRRKNVLSDE